MTNKDKKEIIKQIAYFVDGKKHIKITNVEKQYKLFIKKFKKAVGDLC